MSGMVGKDIFERIGVDMSSRDLQVLRLLIGMEKSLNGVTFAELFDHLKEKGMKLSKVWIYKCLGRLEDEGFISTERIESPRQYKTSEGFIAEALKRKLSSRVNELKSDQAELKGGLKTLKDTTVRDLTMMAYGTIVGSVPIDTSTVIEGVENVRSTLIREIFQKARPGDIIRQIAPIQAIDRDYETSGVTEMQLLMKAAEGIRLRSILVPTEDASRDPGVITRYIGGLGKLLQEVMKTGNIEVRSPKTPLKTYRIVALNTDVMLLYLTHSPASDMAALVRREDNPGLVDDALNTFDKIWDEGVNVMETMARLAELRASEDSGA
jgi:DNA-binding PadR family transcriptional regulator